MINYKKFDKDYYTTECIQENLKNCIGRKTVEVFNATVNNHKAIAVYHYNALICVWDIEADEIYCNYFFYDFSASTSRVRNQFIRYCLGGMYLQVPTTKQLQKIEKTGEVIKMYTSYIVVEKIESNRNF